MQWAQSRWWFALPALVCGLLTALLLHGSGTMYWGAIDSDLTNQFYPWQVFIHRWFSRGVFPFWDPHVFSGYPTLETQQMLALNPVHLASLLMRPELGLGFQMAAHTVIAALGMAFGLRRWGGVSAFAAAAAGVLYVLGALFTVRVIAGHFTVVAAMAWWPLASLSLLGAMRGIVGPGEGGQGRLSWILDVVRSQSRLLAVSALCHAMVILAGGPQYVAYLFYIDAAVVLACTPWPRLGAAIACAALVWILAVVVSAPQWLPALWYLPFSGRAASSGLGGVSLAPLKNLWLEFIIPYPFGDDVWLEHLHFKNVWETATYPGTVAIILLLAGIARLIERGVPVWRLKTKWTGSPRRMLAMLGFDPIALAAFLMLLLGCYMIIGGWLPGFGGFREPTKARAVVAFALPMFCAAVIDGILRRPRQWRWPLLAGVAGQLLMLLAAWQYANTEAFLELLKSFGTPMDPYAAGRYMKTMDRPEGALGFYQKFLIASAQISGLVLVLWVFSWLLPRLSVLAMAGLAMADVLVFSGQLWITQHLYADVGKVPNGIEEFFVPKLPAINSGQELPWRAILNPGIINRTHHYDGFYEFYGYDPLAPAQTAGRNRIIGAEKIQIPEDFSWRVPLLVRSGNRYDASRVELPQLYGYDTTTMPVVLEAPGASLYDVSRNVEPQLLQNGLYGPDLAGRHFVQEEGSPPHNRDDQAAVDSQFAARIRELFPPGNFETSSPSTLLPGEWFRPANLQRPDEWAVRVRLSAPALVVLKMTWLPGWRVAMDGEDHGGAIFANNWMVAAVVPAGEHEVLFRYRPVAWKPSLVIGFAGVGIMVGLLVTGRRRFR